MQKSSDPLHESSSKFNKKSDVSISTKIETLEFMDMDIIGSEEEYLIDTFLDPIDIWKHKKNNKETRDKISFKQYMVFLI